MYNVSGKKFCVLVQVMHGDMMNGDIVLIACDSALLRLTACMLREISSRDQLYRFCRYGCVQLM